MTPEEHTRLRQHRITASRAKDLLSENFKTWNRLARDMREEPTRILGQKCGVPALDWGTENEPKVRAMVWEQNPGWDIENVGFQTMVSRESTGYPQMIVDHVGASPDGWIPQIGFGYEGKAPFNPENHNYYLSLGMVPELYVPQVQWSLWVTGWPGWVFASGDPRRNDDGRLMVAKMIPDPAMHQRFVELSIRFLESYLAGEDFKAVSSTASTFTKMFGG